MNTKNKKLFKNLGIFGIIIIIIIIIFTIKSSDSIKSESVQESPESNYYAKPQVNDLPVNVDNEVKPQCHPNYSGCLKADASDYDCIGGSGNGPYYTGKVRVIGPDVFGLDRDKDGWGCE